MKNSITRSALAIAIASLVSSEAALASSHREAPNVTRLPTIDSTDFYAFNSYQDGREDFVTFIANYIPLQDGYGGPNYFAMDPNAVYEIHIDNDGDAIEDLTFQFKFQQALGVSGGVALTIGEGENAKQVGIPLKNFGNVDTDNSVNFKETYTIKLIKGDRRDGMATDLTGDNGTSFSKPLDNIGEKSFTDYDAYASSFIHDMSIPGCDTGSKVFVGQRKDPFVVNLGRTFDLVNYVPLDNGTNQSDSNDDLLDKNVTTIAIEVPKSCITGSGNGVIGGWTTASLPQARILNPQATFDKPSVDGGALVQVSRLGMPLVNEVVIGLNDKDLFSSSEPKDDAQFADYVTHPTLPALLDILFRTPLGATENIAPSNIPRNDLVTAFLTGFPGVNQLATVTGSEMLRLNTGIDATPAADQSAFGVVAGDLAGFPNGRRPGDDVVDIALRVVMGALCHPVDLDGDGTATDDLGLCSPSDAPVGDQPFSDLAPIDATYVDSTFPYLKAPLAGSVNP
ncbi:DUF4331 domain-containing protein [Thalassolituus oleivorans]|uniref:DUF4331 domain-containing protein n=1 Tax=Thalassolituus oleivorans TaxID=187493 RepID=UPI0023F2242D|nr:DUF4331 domain-containing protein [Thalassolituus oleivorans]